MTAASALTGDTFSRAGSTYRFADHEEVFQAGDAFYLPPGHVPVVDAGSEFVQFSPSEELAIVTTAMMKNMQAMQGA
jgi:hypothetical protein